MNLLMCEVFSGSFHYARRITLTNHTSESMLDDAMVMGLAGFPVGWKPGHG